MEHGLARGQLDWSSGLWELSVHSPIKSAPSQDGSSETAWMKAQGRAFGDVWGRRCHKHGKSVCLKISRDINIVYFDIHSYI